ncbi:MAG TPA: DUF222 domain-containing protein [Acidimicrobiales bacterium]
MFVVKSVEEEVNGQEAALARFCAGFDPEAVPLEQAATIYETLARMEKLVAGARVRLAARVEASNVWRQAGHRTAADWLARTAGVTAGVAHAELAASARLAALSATDDALRRGQLSAMQAAVVTDAAAVDPAAEGRLLVEAATASLRQLRDDCARVKAAADPNADARYERIHRERSVRWFADHDGAWNLHARGPVHLGARFVAALRPLIDNAFTKARDDERHEPEAAYAFDALVALAEGSGRGPGRREKYLALLRVDLEALCRGAVETDECCELTGIGPVPVRVARELLGDAVLQLVITRGRDVASVVHLGRGPSAAQKIALLWSQPTCSRQGCGQLWTHAEVDHRVPWAQTHQTELGGLDRLCRHDHRLKTNHGWALVPGTGPRPMVPPGHPDHPDHPDRAGRDPP